MSVILKFCSIVVFSAIFIPSTLFSQGMMGNGNSYGGMMSGYYNNRGEALEKSEAVKSILIKIRKEQGLKEEESIDPDKVSPKLQEELGDALWAL